jgi:hypothetical protein
MGIARRCQLPDGATPRRSCAASNRQESGVHLAGTTMKVAEQGWERGPHPQCLGWVSNSLPVGAHLGLMFRGGLHQALEMFSCLQIREEYVTALYSSREEYSVRPQRKICESWPCALNN